MKPLFALILASLIPSASFQSTASGFIVPSLLNMFVPTQPLIEKLTKLSENPNNITEASLNEVNQDLKDISKKLQNILDNSRLYSFSDAGLDLLTSQLNAIRDQAAKLPINPIDTLRNQGVDVNALFDQVIAAADDIIHVRASN